MLSVSVTTRDGEGDLSPTAINAEAVTVDPPAPIVSITGNPQEGQVLAAHASTADADVSITYQWQRSSDGVHFGDISGATASTYVPTENDEGRLIRVHVVSTDGEGDSNTAISTPTSAVLDAAPTVTTPVISGTVQEGQTLTAAASAGQGDNPVTYAWYSSADNYTTAIGSGPTYLVQEGDEGFTIEATTTATNDKRVAATAPTPGISGRETEGQTLTASATAGQLDNPVTYQWQRDGSDINGATGATYVVQEGDEGHKLDVATTATNEQGLTASATSAATAAVLDAPPTATTPVISGPVHKARPHP